MRELKPRAGNIPTKMADNCVQTKYQSLDLRTHVEKKGMWAGRTGLAAIDDLEGGVYQIVTAGDGARTARIVAQPIPREHTPALLKSFDEYLVNASDHAAECATGRGAQVTEIAVTLDAAGTFSVHNDGPGIPVVRHAAASASRGRPVYIPEIAFCVMLSGSNMEKSAHSIKGGINGVGAKIGNIHSRAFEFTTVGKDEAGAQHFYAQRCTDRMHTVEPPRIVPLAAWPPERGPRPAPHTRVTMHPAYAALGYGAVSAAEHARAGSKWREAHGDLEAWLRLRCCQLAAYLGPKVRVTLNGLPIATTSAARLAAVHMPDLAGARVIETALKAKAEPFRQHPWRVALVVSADVHAFAHHAIINGVVTRAGPHVTYIKNILKAATLARVKSVTKDKDVKLSVSDVCKHAMLVMIGAIPGADWTGQNKNELTISADTLKHYAFPAGALKEASEALCAMYLQSSGSKASAPATKKKIDKYEPAKNAGRRKGGPVASLMAAEGDSAMTLLRAGLTLGAKNPGGPTFDNYGLFSLRGVPINVAKAVKSIAHIVGAADGAPSSQRLSRTTTLCNNVTFSFLERATGLCHAHSYAETPQGDAEFAKLHYKCVIACVDQDVDGSGKILGLLLTYFNTFWPALIRRGFVRWFMTPVIRVYPRAANTAALRKRHGSVCEFYHEQAFEAWVADPAGGGGSMGALAERYCVSYFKGLGGHDSFEIPGMFRDFERRVYTFTLDAESERLFDDYYGSNTGPRKAILSTPMRPADPAVLAAMEATRRVPCSLQLNQYSKAYKLDAMTRQLPGALDGLTVGRRKALAGARERFTSPGQECMTFQLASFVADRKLYHHGGASMENTIKYMCQTFPGSRQVPLLIGTGDFGTRLRGGQDSASARYTKVALNTRLVNCLFPAVDTPLLPHVFVDGRRAEPHSYVPIIPLLVTENMDQPSEGWNYKCHGRRVSQVVDILRAVCAPAHPGHADLATILPGVFGRAAAAPAAAAAAYQRVVARHPLDISLRGLTGRVAARGKSLYHYGTYALETAPGDPDGARGCVIRVTDLPTRVWTGPFSEALAARGDAPAGKDKKDGPRAALITAVNDYSSADTCDIRVALAPGALAQIRSKYAKPGLDPIEEYLSLYHDISSNLNPIRPDPHGTGGVIEFGQNYHAVVLYFIPTRVRYYRLRFERLRAILEVRLRLESEVVRFVRLVAAGTIAPVSTIADVQAAARVLAGHGFPLINKARVDNPRFDSIAEIRGLVVECGAAAAGAAGDADDAAADDDAAAADDAAADDTAAVASGRASYNYILNLRERDLIKTNVEKRCAKIRAYEREIADVAVTLAESPFPAASVWLRELDELEAVMRAQECYT